MAAGVYSSVFIATPLLVHLKCSESEVVAGREAGEGAARAQADRYAVGPGVHRRTCRSPTSRDRRRRRRPSDGRHRSPSRRRADRRQPEALGPRPGRAAAARDGAARAARRGRQQPSRQPSPSAARSSAVPDRGRRAPRRSSGSSSTSPTSPSRASSSRTSRRCWPTTRPSRRSSTALAAAGRDDAGRVVVDKVVGMEARGFILAAPVALALGVGLRAGPQGRQAAAARRTPSPTRWSTARRPSRCTATRIAPGDRVLLVDDVLATGGTAQGDPRAGRAVRRRRGRRRPC